MAAHDPNDDPLAGRWCTVPGAKARRVGGATVRRVGTEADPPR